MVFDCNWPNCSKQFDDQKQYNEHLEREHLGEQQKASTSTDDNGTTSQQTTMMVSKIDNKKRICLPVETWVDILLCISRIELAQSVSLTNWLFNAISRPRMDEHNKRIVPPMRFYGSYGLRCSMTNRQIPIAQVPPPINILGFKRLTFKYIDIDDQILEFMRLIKPILGTNVCLHVEYETESVHQLFDIIKGNVSMLAIYYDNFNLLDMEFIKTIQFVKMYVLNGATLVIDRILEWLHSSMGMDEHKPRYLFMCEYDINEMAEICKKRFLESTMPVSFVFHFDKRVVVDKALFSIENHQTGEQMTLGWYNDDEKESYLMLCRSKIGDDQGWREVMQKANKCRSRNGGLQDYRELEEWREVMEKVYNPDDNQTHLTHLRLRL